MLQKPFHLDLKSGIWGGWSKSFQGIWNKRQQDIQSKIRNRKVEWLRENRDFRAWSGPDISFQRPYRDDNDETRLILEGYMLMKEWDALDDLEKIFRRPNQRAELWKEITEFWRMQDVYPRTPVESPSEHV